MDVGLQSYSQPPPIERQHENDPSLNAHLLTPSYSSNLFLQEKEQFTGKYNGSVIKLGSHSLNWFVCFTFLPLGPYQELEVLASCYLMESTNFVQYILYVNQPCDLPGWTACTERIYP